MPVSGKKRSRKVFATPKQEAMFLLTKDYYWSRVNIADGRSARALGDPQRGSPPQRPATQNYALNTSPLQNSRSRSAPRQNASRKIRVTEKSAKRAKNSKTDDTGPFRTRNTEIIDLTVIPDEVMPRSVSGGEHDNSDITGLKDSVRSEAFLNISRRTSEQYVSPLNVDERQVIKILTTNAKPDTKLASFRKAEHAKGMYVNYLKGASFKRLSPDEWVDDEIVNAYAMLLNKRSSELVESVRNRKGHRYRKTHMFSSYFFFTLNSKKPFTHSSVERWTTKANIRILDFDLLLFPINIANCHWVLAAIDIGQKEFIYLDSNHHHDMKQAIPQLRLWLSAEVHARYGQETVTNLKIRSWKQIENQYRFNRRSGMPNILQPKKKKEKQLVRIPLQKDSSSCAIFMLKTADCLSVCKAMFFSQKTIGLMRKRVALDLYRGFLPL